MIDGLLPSMWQQTLAPSFASLSLVQPISSLINISNYLLLTHLPYTPTLWCNPIDMVSSLNKFILFGT
jgi:hypothetical protein